MLKNRYWMFLFLVIYAFGALSTTQTIPFLKELGFNSVQQGFVLASIALFTIFMQVIFGILSDKTGKMKPYLLLVFCAAAICTAWMYFMKLDSIWIMMLSVGFIGGACRTYQSMVDTWSLQIDHQKQKFEKNKALGSVGWALGAWCGAILCSWMNFTVLAVACAALSLAAVFLLVRIQDCQRESTMKWSQLSELIHNKQYVLLVLIMLVLFAMGCADIYLVVDKIIALGGTSFHIGLKWGIQSLAEAPVFLISDRLLKRFNMLSLLVFSTVMFGVRFLVYSFTQNVWLLVMESLFQCVTFPIAVYCTKIGIDQCISNEIKSTGQLAGASVYMGVSLLIMPVFTQMLSDAFSQDFALRVVASFSLIALVLTGVYRKNIS